MRTKVKIRYVDPLRDSFEKLDTYNKGYTTTISQAVQRCMFFDPVSKSKAKSYALDALMTLMSCADDNGYGAWNQESLARRCGRIGVKRLRVALDILIERGFIHEVKHGDEGLPNEYWLLDLVNNPYLILSEAIWIVEGKVGDKQGVTMNKLTEEMDNKLIKKENIYKPMIDEIQECSSLDEKYALAVELVRDRMSEVLGKSFVIPVEEPEEELKEETPKNVVPMKNKKTSGEGSFKEKTTAKMAPRDKPYIFNSTKGSSRLRKKFE